MTPKFKYYIILDGEVTGTDDEEQAHLHASSNDDKIVINAETGALLYDSEEGDAATPADVLAELGDDFDDSQPAGDEEEGTPGG